MQTQLPTEYIEYVVVFHGIGEQRANETVMPVINRMAEIRHSREQPAKKRVISLGMITAQTGSHWLDGDRTVFRGTPWSEFKAIPRDEPAKEEHLEPFLGIPSHDGTNLRFVDGHWADIMQTHYDHVAQPLKDWASSLIGRLEVLSKHSAMPEKERWVLPVLYRLEESLTLLQSLISFKLPGLGAQIFEKYMGDIQLYGEYSVIRGQATKRFHQLFEHIERKHRESLDLDENYVQHSTQRILRPRYTIIAHSLGTIMSLDALMYAHFNKKRVMESGSPLPNLPFTNYDMSDVTVRDERFGERWIDDVEAFVTLGSPIDKFLTIWWNNYRYMEDKALHIREDNFLRERQSKIRHFNYCDEQDPVGHALDLLSTKTTYQRVFSLKEDSVYNRYAVPGVAHNNYWEDIYLFKHIMGNTLDAVPSKPSENTPKPSPQPAKKRKPDRIHALGTDLMTHRPKVYRSVLFFSYYLLPLISIAIMFPAFVVAFGARQDHLPMLLISAAVLVIGQFITFRLIKLMVWWRQILKAKSKARTDARKGQAFARRLFWLSFYFLMAFHYAGSVLFIPGFIAEKGADVSQDFLVTSLLAIGMGIFINLKFSTKRRISVPDHSMRWTVIFTFFLITSVLACLVFSFFPLVEPDARTALGDGGHYSLTVASYFFFSAIVWVYTFVCFIAARGALHYR